MTEPLDFLKSFCKFEKNTVYLMQLVARKKYNEELTQGTECIFREVITCPEEIERKYNKMKCLADNYIGMDGLKFNWYLYVSTNARDVIKAQFELRKRLDQWMVQIINGNNPGHKLGKMDSEWFSCLAVADSRATRYFLLDLDSKEEYAQSCLETFLMNEDVDVLVKRETRNGWHYVTNPFNSEGVKTLFKDQIGYELEVKKDAPVFVEAIMTRGLE